MALGNNTKFYETPNHPFQSGRIAEERELLTLYGLKNKVELWRAQSELRSYHYVKKQVKRLPIVVPVVEHKCTGCHIKLPTDLEMETRIAKEITSCNNCGRLLYC